MLFLPFGLSAKDIADPEKISNEFKEAKRIASNCCHYQFGPAIFNYDMIERDYEQKGSVKGKGSHVKVEYAKMVADLGFNDNNTDDGSGADLSFNASECFEIPYQRGLAEITMQDASGNDAWPQWTSIYPELVFVSFSFQYVRKPNHSYFVDSDGNPLGRIRTQIRVFIDGVSLPGAGPSAPPIDGLSRGTGVAQASLFTTIHAMAVLPAGSHRVTGMAGQANCQLGAEGLESEYQAIQSAPTRGVVIGNRAITVLRFARGGTLRG